ncbi:MAG: TetR/AcrR family transcriptional regulator, partial [Acidimicrobiia bacterium]
QESIVEAARQIIAESGTDGLTMRALSARLGVSLGATYRRIATRDEILTLVAVDLLDSVGAQIDADAPWVDRIRTMVLSYTAVLGQHPGMATFVMEHVAELTPKGMAVTMADALADSGLTGDRANAVNAALFFYVGGTTAAEIAVAGSGVTTGWLSERYRSGLEVLLQGIVALADERITVQ